jgi:hypothetical protein
MAAVRYLAVEPADFELLEKYSPAQESNAFEGISITKTTPGFDRAPTPRELSLTSDLEKSTPRRSMRFVL